MHDGMQYDPIQGQDYEHLKVRKSTIFKGYLLIIYNGGWQMTTDSYIMAQYLQYIGAGCLIFVLVLCHTTLKLVVSRSRPSVPYGANCCFSVFPYFFRFCAIHKIKLAISSAVEHMQINRIVE